MRSLTVRSIMIAICVVCVVVVAVLSLLPRRRP